ncbi:MAG: sigma-70 family RNA polymerase sigma factor [Deltaproteobacteria bacterium]|nr:sigma-70 family RNA polymerase sigma factor [Deltaproteobacteria bacterium]
MNRRSRKTTADLVTAARLGDRRSFDQLVLRYRPRIYALALHLTGSESEADDVTQEVFLKAFKALEGFAGRSQFFTWLYRIAVNRSLNARRAAAHPLRQVARGDDPRVTRAVAVDAGGDPARAAELRQSYQRLIQALDGLPESMRTTVVLVALQGLSHAEAAAIEGCSTGTIAWRIHQARQRLKQRISAPTRRIATTEVAIILGRWGAPASLGPH